MRARGTSDSGDLDHEVIRVDILRFEKITARKS
jgi:hypothetical protein